MQFNSDDENTGKANSLLEVQIIQNWQDQLWDRPDLVTEDGEPVKVVYPGRLNGDGGADFTDAVIATKQGRIKGDIEFHVKSSNWRAHGHHHDPAYNRVVLHIVFWNDTGGPAHLQNGKRIPTLELSKYLRRPNGKHPASSRRPAYSGMPCQKATGHRDTGLLAEFLDQAGEERFLAKAAGFQATLAHTEAAEALYQALMGALGYAKNKSPFLELARRLPLRALEVITKSEATETECLARQQALLLGTAGLLPSQCRHRHPAGNGDGWVGQLERIWAATRQTGIMSEQDWYFARVRPSNLPPRRIAAMSYLLLRYRKSGMLEKAIARVGETPAVNGSRSLEEFLVVTSDGYWADHFDPTLPSRTRAPSLLGHRRAADIAVNVILPFAFAWGKLASHQELARKSLGLYQNYPRLAINALEKHMRHQLSLNSDLIDSARRQQGLIHIYRTLCSQGRCQQCPISKISD